MLGNHEIRDLAEEELKNLEGVIVSGSDNPEEIKEPIRSFSRLMDEYSGVLDEDDKQKYMTEFSRIISEGAKYNQNDTRI